MTGKRRDFFFFFSVATSGIQTHAPMSLNQLSQPFLLPLITGTALE